VCWTCLWANFKCQKVSVRFLCTVVHLFQLHQICLLLVASCHWLLSVSEFLLASTELGYVSSLSTSVTDDILEFAFCCEVTALSTPITGGSRFQDCLQWYHKFCYETNCTVGSAPFNYSAFISAASIPWAIFRASLKVSSLWMSSESPRYGYCIQVYHEEFLPS